MSIASEPVIERVAPNVWAAAPAPGDGMMTVVATDEGRVVIDTTSYPVFARQVRGLVDHETSGSWRFVINTHRHFDHVAGNSAFEECVFIAPRLVYEAMQAYTPDWVDARVADWESQGRFRRDWLGEDFHFVLPQVSFEREFTLRLGGITFEAMSLGGHNPECTAVFLIEPRILVASDLVFNGKPAYLGEGDRWQWISALKKLMQLQPTVVIPGHGQVGGAELLEQQLIELTKRE